MHPKILPKLTTLQIQVILGSMLGDGYIAYRPLAGYRNAYLCIRQEDKQYTIYKNKLLKGLVTGHIGHQIVIRKDKNNRREDTYYFNSFTHKELTSFWNLFYSTGVKIIPQYLLKNIKPLGLAIWFMDDGCLQGKPSSRYFKFSTNSFTLQENKSLQKMFKNRFGINSNIHKSMNSCILLLTKEGTDKFRKLIKKFIIPSMHYKLG